MKPRSRNISEAKVWELLSSVEHHVDAELSARLGTLVVYRLADGRALVTQPPFDLSGRLYDSYDEMIEMLKEVEEEAKRGPVSVAEDLKLDEYFSEHAQSLADKVPDVIRVEARRCDFSLASLDHIDRALRKMPHNRRLAPKRIVPLLAYFGEVVRRRTDGRWLMRRVERSDYSEPFIVVDDGRRFSLLIVYKELYESGASLSALASVAITNLS